MPVLLNQLTDITVEENGPAELTVRVSGESSPQVEWSHNGVVLKQGVHYQVSGERKQMCRKVGFY